MKTHMMFAIETFRHIVPTPRDYKASHTLFYYVTNYAIYVSTCLKNTKRIEANSIVLSLTTFLCYFQKLCMSLFNMRTMKLAKDKDNKA